MSEANEPGTSEPISIYQMIMIMTEQMATIAWQKLGLQPDMITGQIAKNVEEAKVAIDVCTGLAAFLEPQLDEADKRRIHGLIRDLKINYVGQLEG